MSGDNQEEEIEGLGMNARVKEFLFPSRTAPVRSTTQAAHVRERKFNGNTKAMAAAYGVTPRTVERWIAGTRKPVKFADRLHRDAADVQTTPRGRERRAREMEARGDRSGIGARVGRANTFNVRGSDAVRARDIHLDLTGSQVAALARATEESEVQDIIKQALATYFNGGSVYGGFTADDFDFDINDVDYSGT
ncbi:hypothetical protein [Streptomyces sp. NBC_01601]|uniref:hypothetical protein n=1 Tax=Streptomyces sp. NBC_01601 TaxID=2975892 RepID=UPI002E27F54C|nr:hypothetical protein [Streptomyces sp. NBC_01601]